jgi:hypothetical protein
MVATLTFFLESLHGNGSCTDNRLADAVRRVSVKNLSMYCMYSKCAAAASQNYKMAAFMWTRWQCITRQYGLFYTAIFKWFYCDMFKSRSTDKIYKFIHQDSKLCMKFRRNLEKTSLVDLLKCPLKHF